MRVLMIVLLILSCFDIKVTYYNGHSTNYNWVFPVITLIVFLTNY